MAQTLRPLVICYSRQGHSLRVAEAFVRGTDAELEVVETERYRWPLIWIFRAIRDVATGRQPSLRGFAWDDLSQRPWIVVCGPVWASRPAAPVASVLSRLHGLPVPIGVLLTYGGTTRSSELAEWLETGLGRPPDATCFTTNSEEGKPEMTRRLERLAADMHAARAGAAA